MIAKEHSAIAARSSCQTAARFRARPAGSPALNLPSQSLAFARDDPNYVSRCRSEDDFAARETAGHSPGSTEAAVHLNSLEVALLAQFNLEMAAVYDEVAGDLASALSRAEPVRESASRREDEPR